MKLVFTTVLLMIAAAVAAAQDSKKFKSDADVPRIEIADAKKAFDANSVLFVDARSLDVYNDEHITGAIDVPYGAPEKQVDSIPKGKTIIVYCS